MGTTTHSPEPRDGGREPAARYAPLASGGLLARLGDMAKRPHIDLGAARRGSPLRAAERDPANELYDQACSLLEAAQGLRVAASSWHSAPALAASLGCIEASLRELRDATREMRDAALASPADPRGRTSAGRAEPLRIRASFGLLARDLSASRSSCAAVRRLVGPALAKR